MSRLRISPAVAGVLAALAAHPGVAAIPDPATKCAILFTPNAKKLATVGGTLYPYYWYRTALTSTSVTLALVVKGSGGSVTYSGFVCNVAANGTVTTASSPSGSQ